MREHVSAQALEAYVIGALDDGVLAEVEAHVMVCKACEARLQNEARLDMVFTALAHETRPHKTATRTYAAPFAFAGTAFAMAAAMILWVLPHNSDAERPQSSEPPVLTDTNAGDASTHDGVTASLELQVDGSRVGVRD